MALTVCVGNRQGGVGKSTVTMMLAHGFAFLAQKRVLVIDLDTQCNSSFAMVGSRRVQETHKEEVTLSNYMGKRMRGRPVRAANFILKNVGDVSRDSSGTNIDLIPSSIDLDEDIQEAIIETRLADPFNSMNFYMRELLREIDEAYDYILMDCPPGLSPMVNAAIHLGHRVIIPFRPDYISQYALDRMADKVEKTGRGSLTRRALKGIPHERRRYISVVNMHGGTQREERILDDFAGAHPRLNTRLRRQPDLAEAFYWDEDMRTLREKYGKAEAQVRQLCNDVLERLEITNPSNLQAAASSHVGTQAQSALGA